MPSNTRILLLGCLIGILQTSVALALLAQAPSAPVSVPPAAAR